MSSSSARPDRKTLEKNRRIKMKLLYTELFSLLPSPLVVRERGSVSLPDRLDKMVNYINGLTERIHAMNAKKRKLLGGEGSSSQGGMRLPHIEVQDHGVGLQVVIASSPGDWFVFNEAIRVVEAEGAEIVNANFSVAGDKAYHIIHLLAGGPNSGQEASKLLERLKREIHLLF